MTTWDARTGWLDAAQRAADHRTGLAPYYPFLYACALGLKAQRVLEFGAGESSHVLANAMRVTGGRLISIAPQEPAGYSTAQSYWYHFNARSNEVWDKLPNWGPYDLVLHDGSHDAVTVSADLLAVLPRVRRHGLVLVHDAWHSYSGPSVRQGLSELLWAKRGSLEVGVEEVTLPFAFGLHCIRIVRTTHVAGPVDPTGLDKLSSRHQTVPGEITL